jgi:hypothetical protein
LLEQSLWWLVPFVLLILLMVHAMMEFTVSLLVQRPTRRRSITADELRQRLLALDDPDRPYRLTEGTDCDLEIVADLAEPPPPARFAISDGDSRYRLRLLLDEQCHELRLNQVTHSYYYFLGLVGWLPRLHGYASAQSGPPGRFMTQEINQIAIRGGWSVRPVLWWFQATYQGYRLLKRLTPRPLRRLSARRFWGILYPLSYGLSIGYLLAIIGPPDQDDLWLVFGVSAGWWGVWAFLVWMLCGFPAFWRRRSR